MLSGMLKRISKLICTQLKIFPVSCFVLLGNIFDGSNGDVAVDQYHRYMVSLAVVSFHFIYFFLLGFSLYFVALYWFL